MADFPIMPVGTSDFLADTGHLSNEQMGLYWRMCLNLWRMPERRFPNDDEWLAKRFRSTAEDVRAMVVEFFVCDGNWIRHKRIEKEHARVSESCRKQSDRAKSRWTKGKDASRGNAGSAMPSTSTSSSLRSEDEKETPPTGGAKKADAGASPPAVAGSSLAERFPTASRLGKAGRGKAYPDEFEAVWQTYPTREEDGKPDCYVHFRRWVVEMGADPGDILAGARAWAREQSGSEYRLGARKWLKNGMWGQPPPRRNNGHGVMASATSAARKMGTGNRDFDYDDGEEQQPTLSRLLGAPAAGRA